MSLLLANRALSNPILGERILITMTPTALFTVGFNLTFASGTLTIDWKDGSATEDFVSGVELTHEYVSSGTNIAEISGDLSSITKFIGDSNLITDIANLKTGLLTQLTLSTNLLASPLDLTLAAVSGAVNLSGNTSMGNPIWATSGNGQVTNLQLNGCGLTGNVSLSDITIAGIVRLDTNPSLTGVTFASSGNGTVTSLRIENTSFAGNLDLSNVNISNEILFRNSTGMTGVTYASSGNGNMLSFQMFNCDLGYVDFTTFTFTGNNAKLLIDNNNMTTAEVNHILVDMAALADAAGTGKNIDISENAAPDGSSGGFDGDQAVIDLIALGIAVTTS